LAKENAVVVLSLQLEIDLIDGTYIVSAPWLGEPLEGPNFEELYFQALAMK